MTRLGVSAALLEGCWVRGDVDVVNGRIIAVGLLPAVGSAVLVSGFVEHQLNGFAGVDFRSCDELGYERVADALVSTGVTEFHPTVFSLSVDGYINALTVLNRVHGLQVTRRAGAAGARVLGMHLEGPFLSPRWCGAHDPATFIDPDRGIIDVLLAAGPVSIMTLAPELPGAIEAIKHLAELSVAVSIGHTDANSAQCRAAFDAGATMITHWGNAHRRFMPRDPGPAAAALLDERVRVGLIADGVHVADDALRLVAQSAGDRMMLVTDAIVAAGVAPEDWNALGTPVTVADGSARLADGTLAGSVTTMDACVRHMIHLGVTPSTALSAAGGNRLRVGHTIGLVVLDDRWEVCDVHTAGAASTPTTT